MRYIVTTNRHIQLIEDNGNGKILDSKGFQFGQLYYRIVKGKVTFYHFDQEQPWRNDVWSADIPLQINGELYETEEEVGNKLYEVMEDSLFDKIEDLGKEDARLDQKIDDEIDRAKEEEANLQEQIDAIDTESIERKLDQEIARSTSKDTEHDNLISGLTNVVNNEITRSTAKDAEHDGLISGLTTSLDNEISRAINAENNLLSGLTSEISRATAAENELDIKIDNEITRSTEKDAIHDEKLANLGTSLQNEIERATEAENSLRNDLNGEVSRATAEEERIDAKIDKEISDRIADVNAEETRAKAAESSLDNKLDAEILRSTNKDTEHDNLISGITEDIDGLEAELNSEIQRALSAETNLHTEILDEKNRAINAESVLTNALSSEITRATNAENALDAKIDQEIADRTNADSALNTKIENEITRSTAKDAEHDEKISGLTDGLDSEIARATARENQIGTKLDNEIARATAAESTLDAKIDKEIADRIAEVNAEETRATSEEQRIEGKLDSEITRSTAKDASHDSLISGLTTSLQNEIQRSQNVENALRSDLNTETSARTAADTAQIERIVALEVGKANKSEVYTKAESDEKFATKDYISGITDNFYTKGQTNELLAAKADTSAVTEVSNTLAAHTANTDIHVTVADKEAWNAKLDAEDVEGFFGAVNYDKTNKRINFYNTSTGGTVLGYVDATDFIKDGMVSNVEIKEVSGKGTCLVITFNTDSGKEPISIPLSDIFNPNNYYTKDEINASQAAQDAKINEISGKTDNVITDVQTLSGEVQTISGKVETISGDVITLSGNVGSLSGKVETISGDVQTISGEVHTISGKVDDIKAYKAGRGITIASGQTADTISFNLPISAGTRTDSIIQGYKAQAKGDYSHAEGGYTTAIGNSSHAEGFYTIASGDYSHAEGSQTEAKAFASHAEGRFTSAYTPYSFVCGINGEASGHSTLVEDTNTIFAIGNGKDDTHKTTYVHNALEVKLNGDIYISSGGTRSGSLFKLQDALGQGGGGGVTPSEVQTMIDESISGKTNQSDFTAHTANTIVHVTASEKSTWNAKSDFSGDYNDLSNKPTIPNYTAGDGITISNNVISAKIWQGTKAEYDALSTKDAGTIYLIYNS